MATVASIRAREILDSRGVPTIEVDLTLDTGACGRAAAPAGASKGTREAVELRDEHDERYGGRGVRCAIHKVACVIAPAIVGKILPDRRALDLALIELDGTENRSHLGANTILAVSIAAARAFAGQVSLYEYLAPDRMQLPVPMLNVLNGGAHADNQVDFEEFMIAPVGASSFSEALRMGVDTYRSLRALLKRAGKATAVGDESGFAPDLESHTQAPEMLLAAIEQAGLRPRSDIVIAVDAAADELYEDGTYVFRKSRRRRRTTEQMIRLYETWVKHYVIWSIEDALAEVDKEGWRALNAALGNKVQLAGDDIFVTNAALLRAGISQGIANAIVIKPNQVGTVSETWDAISAAQDGAYEVIVCHRAGETNDDFIADLAVAANAGQLKAGGPARGECVAKYNRLLRIEEGLGSAARFAGHFFVQRGGFVANASNFKLRTQPKKPQESDSASFP
jgi:enolase